MAHQRLEIRISAADKARLQRAASWSGLPLSAFVLYHAHVAATHTFQNDIELTRRDKELFLESLLKSVQPSRSLLSTASRYRPWMGRVTPLSGQTRRALYLVERLHPRLHNRAAAAFRSGDVSLDEYLRQQAGLDISRSRAFTYVLLPSGRPVEILGYFTLAPVAVRLHDVLSSDVIQLPFHQLAPLMLLERMVGQADQAAVLRSHLLVAALQLSLAASPLGSSAVLAEADNREDLVFYQNNGFRALVDSPQRLFLPMQVVRDVFTR
jgi:uncharacterized protein (DUF1778 family)